MSMKSQQQCDQSDAIEFSELSERERMFLKLFKQLDEVSQQDIIRFINVLLGR